MRLTSPRDLGAAVQEERQRQGVRQAELASTAGVSREWLSRFENGAPRVELVHVFRVVAALGFELRLEPSTVPTGSTAADDLFESLER